MKQRSKAREAALQALYQSELAGSNDAGVPEKVESLAGEARKYYDELTAGVRAKSPDLDALIEKHSEHWTLTRMTVVDRSILRIAAFELCHLAEVPFKVIIDEAVELAKRYGSDDSGAFINGVLDKLAREARPSRAGA